MRDVSVGRRIRTVRERLALTQAQFGKKLGVIKVSVARYEAGRVARADILDRIARAGGVTTTWLLHGELDERLLHHTQSLATAAALPNFLREVLGVLRPDWTSKPWVQLPSSYRDKYEERVRDAALRLKRELEEYRKLLEAQRRMDQRRGKKNP